MTTLSFHHFESQEEWEKAHGEVAGKAMMTLEDGEAIYKNWVLGVEGDKLQQVKILSKRRKVDGKVRAMIVWEFLEKDKVGYLLDDWLTDEEFLEWAYHQMLKIGKKHPKRVWEKVETHQFHFAKIGE